MKISKVVVRPYEEVLNYPKFDLNKPVKKQRKLLLPLVWALSLPETYKRKLKIKEVNMEQFKDQPYLMLNNHNSFYDFKVATRAIFPRRATYVVAIDGFINREGIMREVGCFGKRKFINDIQVVKQIKKSIINLNHICMLYPEARYSHVGTNAILPNSLGKLIKLLKVPVVSLITKGNHLVQPVWNLKKRKVNTEAVLTGLLTVEQINNLTADEINEIVNETFMYDDYMWQKDNNIKISEKFRAEGLEHVLYKCPVCLDEYHMHSKDNILFCNNCHSKWEMNEFGELINDHNSFTHIPNWYEWQRQMVKEEIIAGNYYFSHHVNLNSLPSSQGFYQVGEGELIHTVDGFKFIGKDINKNEFEIIQPAINNYSIHVEYNYFGRGHGISFSTNKDTFYMFSKEKSYLVTKVHFAVEEIYKLLQEKLSDKND